MKLSPVNKSSRSSSSTKPASLDEAASIYKKMLEQKLKRFGIQEVAGAIGIGRSNKETSIKVIGVRFNNPHVEKKTVDGRALGEDVDFDVVIFDPHPGRDFDCSRIETEIFYDIVKNSDVPERQGLPKFYQAFNHLLTPAEVGKYFQDFLNSYKSLIKQWDVVRFSS